MPEIHVTAQCTDSPFEFSEVHSMVDASEVEVLQLVAVILDGLAEKAEMSRYELLLFLYVIWMGMESDSGDMLPPPKEAGASCSTVEAH